MHEKDLTLLEFPRIREIVSGYCSFSMSRALALELLPSSELDQIKRRLAESAEARRLLELEPGFSVYGLSDIAEPARYAALGRVLEPKILAEIRKSLGLLRRLKSKLDETAVSTPLLNQAASEIGDFAHLEKNLDKAISPEGSLLPHASEKLSLIRLRLRTKRSEVMERLQDFIQSDNTRRYIQEPIITEREGRFAIPVKAEHKGEIKGIVHDVSNSGATVFVEPFSTLDLGNEFKELEIEEMREIERILTELSAQVGALAPAIENGLGAAAKIDFALAKAGYAKRAGAREVEVYEPSATDPAMIRLDTARHPLLGAGAVPLSIELGKDFSILVITGPNTGGKTVALKVIGLLCLMTQAGLPVPAGEKTRLPVFRGIFADIGDEQSVQAALSTFSGHMSNIARILNNLKEKSLVLLDELGASTDPQEGSAIARAVLLHLLAKGVIGGATSHFTDLKVFAHVTPGMQNASFDFNPQTLAPTYHLTLGMPGGSNAIATAARFGIPAEVIGQAEAMLTEGTRQLEQLLAELQVEKKRLTDIEKTLEREKELLQKQNQALALELKTHREEKQAIIQQARDNVIEEVAALQKDLKQARNALERQKSEAALLMARNVSEDVRERLKKGIWQVPDSAKPDTDEGQLTAGDRVWLKEAEVEAVVLSQNERTGQVEVSSGPLRFKLGREGVTRLTGKSKDPRPAVQVLSSGRNARLELDLRGRRAEHVSPMLDEFLDDAASASLQEVRVIHGHGTGVLRSIVRELAARHPLVASLSAAPRDQGGDGATMLRLK
ncbi:endonuclease MutS2 [Dehalogenimonas alkenigignens]|uniref:endonuclease MutS2 n=1 Tax=Dehalogenimonas alkenigignens TaxID=1217799 RepID=UPI000D57CFB7|nr:endonuclease MutS2 [Dehalogenimonas alkenigignens]PVV85117.1 endonuclease MutS2 [Dehalogenimonas alkenigignens]